MLHYLADTYGIDSREYKTVLNRIKMCTKLQSAQIDKAKIGRNVKGIPKTWTDRKYIEGMDIEKDEKQFLKRIMMDRHPYFFIYLYPDTKRKYNKYMEEYNLSCKHKFNLTIDELINKTDRTDEESHYLQSFYEYMPVIYSDCVMNNICKHIESVDFDIKNKINKSEYEDTHLLLMRNVNIVNVELYNDISTTYKSVMKELSLMLSNKSNNTNECDTNMIYNKFKNEMDKVCSNINDLVDCLINIFYVDYPSSNKDLLWGAYGEYIVKNLIDKNEESILFPIPNKDGDIEYLHETYKLEEVLTNEKNI